MAPGGEMYRLYEHFGENVLCHGSHEWLPYSKNKVRLKCSNTNLSPSQGYGHFPSLVQHFLGAFQGGFGDFFAADDPGQLPLAAL